MLTFIPTGRGFEEIVTGVVMCDCFEICVYSARHKSTHSCCGVILHCSSGNCLVRLIIGNLFVWMGWAGKESKLRIVLIKLSFCI